MLFVRNPTGVSHSPGRARRGRRLPRRRRGAGTGAGRPGLGDDDARTGPRMPGWAAMPRRRRRAGRRRGRRSPTSSTAPRPTVPAGWPGSRCPGWPTPTRTRSTGRCAGAPSADGGTFWTWREQMYAVAERLDPGLLPRAGPGDLRRDGAGRDHLRGRVPLPAPRPGGTPYADPNAMGEALVQAAGEAGIRITLLDTCYLAGGIGQPLEGPQLRFGDGDADAWATRRLLDTPPETTYGSARRSTRCGRCPADQLARRRGRRRPGPLHVHLSEQRAENEACLAAYGAHADRAAAPTHGALGPRTTAVHATHLTDADIALLGGSGTGVCFCPTTERDLADGIGPARAPSRPRLAPVPRLRQPRGHRPVRGGARGRARRAAGLRAARALARPPSSSPPRPGPGTTRSAGPTPAGSPSAPSPTWSRSA